MAKGRRINAEGVRPSIEADPARVARSVEHVKQRHARKIPQFRVQVVPCSEGRRTDWLDTVAEEQVLFEGISHRLAVADGEIIVLRREIVVAAQLRAVGFYERLGYRAYGDEFEEAGIPHTMMKKQLT